MVKIERLIRSLYHESVDIGRKFLRNPLLSIPFGSAIYLGKGKAIRILNEVLRPIPYTGGYERTDPYIVYGADIMRWISNGLGYIGHQLWESIKTTGRVTVPFIEIALTGVSFVLLASGIYQLGRRICNYLQNRRE
ncbi:MAG: hypothetical protein J7L39_00730 [Candidatus Aenigmarchaeota archaeon]|nr:hypothetical protein [Candidatus Aenigmarchaeota archaeon]